MPTTFSKNAVISGEIDYYCLVCEEKLKTEEYANTHIKKAIHKKSLALTSFAKGCEEDRVRKVKKGYYCEYCNIVLSTSLNVSMHLKDKIHIYNKTEDINVTRTSKDAKWQDNCVVIFDDLLIQENTWNGLIDNNCAFCNVEYENENVHKGESTHVLKLIHAQMLIGENKSIYRKIDSETFHCMTCNEVLPLPPDDHFDEESHDERYNQCRKDMKSFSKKTKDTCTANEAPKPKDSGDYKSELKNSDPILDSLPEWLKNSIYVDFINENATCRKCNKVMDLNAATINYHIGQHKATKTENATISANSESTSNDQTESDFQDGLESGSASEASKSDFGNDDFDSAKFANDNNISLRHSTAYCELCKVTIPISVAGMQEHVKGSKHKQRLAKPKIIVERTVENEDEYRTENFNDFCTEFGRVENFSHQLFIINSRFFIDQYSFHCIRKIGDRLRCNVCQKSLSHSQLISHQESYTHGSGMKSLLVIVSEDTEFLRQIRDGVFHCGFCNLVLLNWRNVKDHLKSTDHKYEKEKHSQIKARYLPQMRSAEFEDAILERIIGIPMSILRILMLQRLRNNF